jgi:hypothetical protein
MGNGPPKNGRLGIPGAANSIPLVVLEQHFPDRPLCFAAFFTEQSKIPVVKVLDPLELQIQAGLPTQMLQIGSSLPGYQIIYQIGKKDTAAWELFLHDPCPQLPTNGKGILTDGSYEHADALREGFEARQPFGFPGGGEKCSKHQVEGSLWLEREPRDVSRREAGNSPKVGPPVQYPKHPLRIIESRYLYAALGQSKGQTTGAAPDFQDLSALRKQSLLSNKDLGDFPFEITRITSYAFPHLADLVIKSFPPFRGTRLGSAQQ